MGAAGRLGVLLSLWCFFVFVGVFLFLFDDGPWSGVGWPIIKQKQKNTNKNKKTP
jgi:hypothetical protein